MDHLPFAAWIGTTFCVSSGLSPLLMNPTLDLANLKATTARPTKVPDEGILADFLWSQFDNGDDGWHLPGRGELTFGPGVVQSFLEDTGGTHMITSSEILEEGILHFGKLTKIWSTARYMGEFDNDGGLVCINEIGTHHEQRIGKDEVFGDHLLTKRAL